MASLVKTRIGGCSTISRSRRPSRCPSPLWSVMTRALSGTEQAVGVASDQLQAFAATRVRRSGQCTDRTTGNVVAAVFRHDTSRALDPQLHTHCIVFNATYDTGRGPLESAAEPRHADRRRSLSRMSITMRVSRSLRQFGYGIENQRRGDFEIRGVSPALIEKFSKRHQEIDQKDPRIAGTPTRERPMATSRLSATISPTRNGRARQGHHLARIANQLGPAIDCG